MNGITVGRGRPGEGRILTTGGGRHLQAAVPVRRSGRRMYTACLLEEPTHLRWAPVDAVLLRGWWVRCVALLPGFMAALSGLLGAFLLGVFLALPRNPWSLHSYYQRGCFFLPLSFFSFFFLIFIFFPPSLFPVSFFALPQSQSESWPMSSLVQSL